MVEDKIDPDPHGEPDQDNEFDAEIKGSNKKEYGAKWKLEITKAKMDTNKAQHMKSYQLAGEMLAAAVRNFQVYQVPQTVFGLRVVGVYFHFFFLFLIFLTTYEGTRMTFHRADFPVSYLESIKKGTPIGNITILR